ncbi:MAG: DsbC family protein [Burkholderiaceae bacterium]|nr:DsbC family protein [Burkholderiaceae bacterium]
MKIIRITVALVLGAFVAIACANTEAPEVRIKKLVEERLGEGTTVDSVVKAQFHGLYEVRIGSEIMYTDKQVKYMVFGGHVIDLRQHKDLTREHIDQAEKITFADLPFDSAIKMVKGNGKRVIAVFEDPNCGYCKRLRHTLTDMDNVTVYTFMYNILADDSFVKAKNVWCTGDRLKAWDDWMLTGKAPANAPDTCTANPNDKILALGKKFHINATPTIFFADGTRVPGALGAAELEEKWAALQ